MAGSMSLQVVPPCEKKEADSEASAQVAVMRDSALFAGLTHQECRMLALSATRRVFESGSPLFMQGTLIRETIVVETGTVKLSKARSCEDEVIIRINGRSEVLEIPIEWNKSRHTCTARVVERCSLLRWDSRLLHGVMQEYPQIRSNVNNIILQRLSELEERFRELTTEDIASRLARTLVRLVGSIGRKHSRGVLVAVTREELAKISGMSMFTASRVISSWSDEGLVVPLRRAVVLRDPCQFAATFKSPTDSLSVRDGFAADPGTCLASI